MLFKSNIEAKINFIDRYAIDDNGTLYSALCTPITRDGVTIAILYGLINLNDIPKKFPFQIYNGNGQAFLIDAQNGNLLIDTWHKNLGNMYDVHFSSNETKFGTSFEQMRRDIKNERSGLSSLNHSNLVKIFTVTITLSKNIICPFKSSSRNQLLSQKNINFNKLSSRSAVHS